MREGGAFNEHCVVGAAFRSRSRKTTDVIGYFNNQGYHTPATALMLVDNALFKLLAGPDASIQTGNYPMPRNMSETAQSQLSEYVSSLRVLWCLPNYVFILKEMFTSRNKIYR